MDSQSSEVESHDKEGEWKPRSPEDCSIETDATSWISKPRRSTQEERRIRTVRDKDGQSEETKRCSKSVFERMERV